MTLTIHRTFSPLACLALAAFLSACGGGGDSTPPVTPAKAPVALADTVSVTANQEATLDVLANDSHPDKLALELVSVGAAAHGSAALKNGTLVYTPAASYYGPDKISYTVRAVGGTLSATAEATVAVGMPLRLSGKVGVPAATGSTVTITVGTRDFTQAVAADAMYDLPVVLDAPGQMVTVTAQASGAENARIKMISLAGSAASLYAASNGQGTLASAQRADLNVGLVSTGKYATLRRVNGGRVPASQLEFDAAVAIAPAQEMLQMAGVLRLASAPLFDVPVFALPAGISDTLALALDTPAYTAFAKAILQPQEGLVTNATENILGDFRLQTTLNLATDRERVVSLLSANYNSGAFSGTELIISPDGPVKVRYDFQDYAGTWTKGSDAFLISLPKPLQFYDPSWEADVVIYAIALRQMTGGPAHGLVTMTMSGEMVDNNGRRSMYTQTKAVSAHVWDSLPALSVADISGKTLAGLPDWLAPVPGVFLNPPVNQMRVAFAADGTATLLDHVAVSATWTIQDGKLRIALADGSVQELARRSANAGRERWIVRYSKDTQFQLYDALMTQVQPGLSWTPALAAQNWRSLAIEDQGLMPQFFVNLLADFSGTESSVSLDGTPASVSGDSWLLDNGQLVATVFRLPGGGRAGVCPAGVSCTVYTSRRWTLLRDDGDTIMVLDRYTNQSLNLTRVIGYQRRPR